MKFLLHYLRQNLQQKSETHCSFLKKLLHPFQRVNVFLLAGLFMVGFLTGQGSPLNLNADEQNGVQPKVENGVQKRVANQEIPLSSRGPLAPEGNKLGSKISILDLLATFIYGLMGIFLSLLAYKAFDFISPFSVNKEIEEDQNVALGLVLGSMCIGSSMIIAAAIVS